MSGIISLELPTWSRVFACRLSSKTTKSILLDTAGVLAGGFNWIKSLRALPDEYDDLCECDGRNPRSFELPRHVVDLLVGEFYRTLVVVVLVLRLVASTIERRLTIDACVSSGIRLAK